MAGIYKHKDGYKTYLIINGKRKYYYAKTQKELDKKVTIQKSLLYKNIVINDENITFEQWANEWLNKYKTNVEQSTFNMYKSNLNLYIIPVFKYIKLKNIKQIDIIDLLNKMSKKGITRSRDIVLLTLKQIFNKAIENDLIYKNPASNIKVEKHRSKEKKPLNKDIINIINNLAQIDNNLFIILFMIYTGLRKEEIVPIKIKDIKNNILIVNKAVHFENNNKPILKSTKNTEKREIPILDILHKRLKSFIIDKRKTDILFPMKNNEMRSFTSMKRLLEYSLKKINKELVDQEKETTYFTFHQLRHTYATVLYKSDIKIKDAQYLMGHKDVRILLNIYTHLDNQDREISIKKLNNFVKSG